MIEKLLAGILIAMVSGLIGKFLGGYNKVSNNHCNERRQACNLHIITEIRSMKELLVSHITSHTHKDDI